MQHFSQWFPPDSFDLPIYVNLLAVGLFALTGALAALERDYDIIGVFLLAGATGLGGSLIRDGILIAQGTPVVLTDSRYLLAVMCSALMAYLFYKHVQRFSRVIAIVDALGLGAYAVIGVQKSLTAHLSVAGAIVAGLITAVGGGLLRDILIREEPLVLKPGQFYTLAALFGCCLFVALTVYGHVAAGRAAHITILSVFLVRMLAIQFNWRTAPLRSRALFGGK
ncbi:MAG TPA: trimeric intracellular cation channel family protein [Kiritimatiellia bacterium]